MATKTFEELKQLAIQIRDEKTNKQNTATRIGTQILEYLDKLEQDYYDKTATDEKFTEIEEKIEGIGEVDLSGLENKTSSIGYVTCDTAAGTATKIVTVTGLTALSTGIRLLVKMTYNNTASNATLNINGLGAKPLYYNNERVSGDTAWEAGEIVDIYYDGTNFYSGNFQGGSGEGGNLILEWNTDAATTRKQVKLSKRKSLLQISYKNSDGDTINEQYIGNTFTDTEWAKDSNWSLIIDDEKLKDSLEDVPEVSNNTSKDFCISDEKGNIIFYIQNGYPHTKQFNGEELAGSIVSEAKTLTKEDLVPDTYYALGSLGIGSTAPEEPEIYGTTNRWWSCISEVKKGGNIFLKTKGGSNGRAYALTDINRKILSLADSNADYLVDGITLNVEENGFLYINCTELASIDLFICSITYDDSQKLKEQVDSNTKRINTLEKVNVPKKILSVSNSYGCDDLSYLPMILNDLGVTDIELGIAYIASASLQIHFNNLTSGTKYTYHYNNGTVWTSKSITLPEILSSKEWDCIVFQQASSNSGKYETYEPYLTDLIKYCMGLNSNIRIAFNMTQPYANGYGGLSSYNSSQEEMYNGIKKAAANVHYNNGITIIPTGVAVQLARETDLNDYGNYSNHQLSYDGTHLDDGIGRYLAGLTWIVSLLGLSVWTAKFKPEYPLSFKIPDGPRGTFETVTDEMASIAKICAHRAYTNLNKILITEEL